jgi:hypothetical protein
MMRVGETGIDNCVAVPGAGVGFWQNDEKVPATMRLVANAAILAGWNARLLIG